MYLHAKRPSHTGREFRPAYRNIPELSRACPRECLFIYRYFAISRHIEAILAVNRKGKRFRKRERRAAFIEKDSK